MTSARAAAPGAAADDAPAPTPAHAAGNPGMQILAHARIGFYRTVLCRRVLGAAHGPPTHGTGGTRGTRRQPNILGNGRVHLGTQGTLIPAK